MWPFTRALHSPNGWPRNPPKVPVRPVFKPNIVTIKIVSSSPEKEREEKMAVVQVRSCANESIMVRPLGRWCER